MKSKLAAAMNTLSEETRKNYINKYLQDIKLLDIQIHNFQAVNAGRYSTRAFNRKCTLLARLNFIHFTQYLETLQKRRIHT